MPNKRQSSHDEVEPTRLTQAVHNGLGRESVSDIQRARMLAAMVDEVAERGASNVSVAAVVARSGVSRRTFYEIFDDREDCFLTAFDAAVERIAAVVVPAYEQPGPWRTKIRRALTTLIEFLGDESGAGRLVIVESLGAGPQALERRERVLAQIITAVDRGRGENKATPGPPPLTAEGVVGGVLSILHARLTAKNRKPLIELLNPLMGMIVLPYLGPAAARKEIEEPIPKARPKRKVASHDPLCDLEMRLTYRTVRVLMAAAERPGSSNRAVGAYAGIPDQGQISKLLTRLHTLGLIDNSGAGSTRGEPNAWTLTARGWEIHGAITGQISAS